MEKLVGLRVVEQRGDDRLIVEEQWAVSGVELERARMIDGTEERRPVPIIRTETRRGEMTPAEFEALKDYLTTTS